MAKLEARVRRNGYVVRPDGAMAVSVLAAQSCYTGMKALDDNINMRQRHTDGVNWAYGGNPGGRSLTDITECILFDESTFFMTRGKDPSFSLNEKLAALFRFELWARKSEKYFLNAIWSPKDIVEDLTKRITLESQEECRRSFSTLVRGQIIGAFCLSTKGEQGSAVTSVKHALGLLEEGAKKWENISFEEKGMCLKPTFARVVRVYLLKCLLRASRDAKTASAKRAFPLSDVEKLAREIITENKVADWPAFDGGAYRMAYYVMPNWEAYSALAYVSSQRLRAPFADIEKTRNELVFCDVKHAKAAAGSYDKAAKLMPDDAHQKGQMLWYALEAHIRGGGLTIAQFFSRFEEADRLQTESEHFFTKLPADFEPRTFARVQHKAVKESIIGMPPSVTRTVIKPVPTILLDGGMTNAVQQRIMTDPQWNKYEGGVTFCDFIDKSMR